MQSIKHFSFDLWFTLIKSNPNFKKERALYFHKNYNSKSIALSEVENTFRKIDLMCNAINEKTGRNIDAEEMYLMVLYELNNDNSVFENIDLKALYSHLEQMFFNYAPVIYDNKTVEILEMIKQNSDNTMSILSNTAFIKGSTLRCLLSHLNITKYFNFQIYSDEVNVSKPNPIIFRELLNTIQLFRQNIPLDIDKIIHVGDNPIADIKGANAVGIKSFHINTNEKTIQNLFV